MEPLTHFLTGAVLARAGFNRKTALATATMTLAAEAPDLDIFWGFKGPVYGFAHHRGFTHSFLGLFIVSAAVVGFMYLVWLLRGRKTNIPNLPPSWGLLFLFAYIAGLSHILLDFTNNYGVRPFWPFWEKWYSWGVAFIVEPPILILLLAGLLAPLLLRKTHPSQLRSTAPAKLVLVMIVGLWLLRTYEAHEIVRAFDQKTLVSESPLRVSAFPYWPIPSRGHWSTSLQWSAVVETPSFFIVSQAEPFAINSDSWGQVLPKPPETPAILAAKRSYLGRVYMDWAEYPYVTESVEADQTTVDFQDLRFGYPRLGNRSVLAASVTLDNTLAVTGEAMGTRKQVPTLQ